MRLVDGEVKPRGGIWLMLWRGFLLILVMVGAALAIKPASAVFRRTSAMRELSIAAEHLGADELRKPIPCARAAVADEADRERVKAALNVLTDAESRAKAFCLLGERGEALTAYRQGAQRGDVWSAEQAYYLQAQAGEMKAAEQSLGLADIEVKELESFFWGMNRLFPDMDLLPVARQAVEKDPLDKDVWKLWLQASNRLIKMKDYTGAIDVYQEGLAKQETLGAQAGRGSFALRIGRIYQVNVDPHQLETALKYYDQAIAWHEYFDPMDEATAHFYRGEVYAGLKPKYSATQVISEYRRALEIDPKNYWARLSIANTYLYQLKAVDTAELYIHDAIALRPELPNGYLALGDLYRQRGDLNAAKAAYEQALARQPEWQAAMDRLEALRKDMEKTAP